jgi:hypothetical protein
MEGGAASSGTEMTLEATAALLLGNPSTSASDAVDGSSTGT